MEQWLLVSLHASLGVQSFETLTKFHSLNWKEIHLTNMP